MIKKMEGISNPLSYAIITVVALIIVATGIYAFGAVPNPGHSLSQLQGCDSPGQILNWAGTNWECIDTLPTSKITPPSGCLEGQALQWKDGAWKCTFIGPLVNGIHTGYECEVSGGTVISLAEGLICKFGLPNYNPQLAAGGYLPGVCPSGWTKYQQWSETVYAGTCEGGDCSYGITSCETPQGHSWSNIAPEYCLFVQVMSTTDPDICTEKECYTITTQIGCY